MNRIIPKSGAWILIKQIIPVDIPVEPLSLFFAIPTNKLFINKEYHIGMWYNYGLSTEYGNSEALRLFGNWTQIKKAFYQFRRNKKSDFSEDELKFLEEFNDEVTLEQQVKILTPYGEVCIQPYEYSIVDDISKYIEPTKDGHAFLHFLSKNQRLKGKVADQVFYLRSRGIGYADALMMACRNIKTQHLFYITMHKEYQKMFVDGYDSFVDKKRRFEEKKLIEDNERTT